MANTENTTTATDTYGAGECPFDFGVLASVPSYEPPAELVWVEVTDDSGALLERLERVHEEWFIGAASGFGELDSVVPSMDVDVMCAWVETIDQRGENEVAAYVSIFGAEYATPVGFEESYEGFYRSDEEFAEEMADAVGAIPDDLAWPLTCIDWEHAAREIMYDYTAENGFYFRTA